MTCNDTYHAFKSMFCKVSSAQELKDFMDKYSFKHKYFFHFTNMDSFAKIVKTGRWKFCSATKTNDLHEVDQKWSRELWNKLFSCSLSHGDEDNVGMWKMYTKGDEEQTICLRFGISFLKKWVDMMQEEKKYYLSSDAPATSFINFNSFSFHDITYFHGYKNKLSSRICWGNIIVNPHRFKDNNPSLVPASSVETSPFLTGYVKNSAWEYEKESRIMIKIDQPNDEIVKKGIYIDFSKKDFLNSVSIRFSPFLNESDNKEWDFSDAAKARILEERKTLLKKAFDENGVCIPKQIMRKCKMSYFTKYIQ